MFKDIKTYHKMVVGNTSRVDRVIFEPNAHSCLCFQNNSSFGYRFIADC